MEGNDEIDHSIPTHAKPYHGRRRAAISAEPVANAKDDGWSPPVYPKTKEEEERIFAKFETNILFSHLDTEEKDVMVKAMFSVQVGPGTDIIKQGDEGDNFYMIECGTCDIFVKKKTKGAGLPKTPRANRPTDGASKSSLSSHSEPTFPPPPSSVYDPTDVGVKVLTVNPGDCFGELALMYDAPRAATVRTVTDCHLWAVDRTTYKRVLMGATMKKRNRWIDFLEKVPILQSLEHYERLILADCLITKDYEEGQEILAEGDPEGDTFFLVEKGEVSCTQIHEGGQGEVGRLATGDYFGERSLLTHEPRKASVTATKPTRCLVLGRQDFIRVLGPLKDILERNINLYKNYEELIESTNDTT